MNAKMKAWKGNMVFS